MNQRLSGFKYAIAAIIAAVLLGACATKIEKDAKRGYDKAERQADTYLKHNEEKGPVIKDDTADRIKRYNTVYVSTESVPVVKHLPDFFTATPYTVNMAEEVYLDEFSGILSKMTNIPVVLSPELTEGALEQKSKDQQSTPSPKSANYKLRINFVNGNLRDLLDHVAASVGIGWRYQNDRIELYRFVTKTFTIAAPQGAHDGEAKVSNVTTGSTDENNISAQASSQITKITVKTNLWTDLKSAIPTMLSKNGTFWVSESSGTVTVRDSESVVNTVDQYIQSLNGVLSRQVQFLVRVLNVTQDASHKLGINWDLVYRSNDFRFDFDTQRGNVAEQGLSTISGSILKGPWRDTKAFIDALSKQGEVSEITSPQVMTLNNQPAHIIVGRRTSFIGKVEAVAVGDNTGQQTVELRDLITGFSIILQPTILTDRDLQLQIAVDRSSLIELKNIDLSLAGSNDSRKFVIQAPDVDISNSIQRVRLKSNQTIVLTGFEQSSTSGNKQGIGSPEAWAVGGRKDASNKRQMIVILITPIVLG